MEYHPKPEKYQPGTIIRLGHDELDLGIIVQWEEYIRANDKKEEEKSDNEIYFLNLRDNTYGYRKLCVPHGLGNNPDIGISNPPILSKYEARIAILEKIIVLYSMDNIVLKNCGI